MPLTSTICMVAMTALAAAAMSLVVLCVFFELITSKVLSACVRARLAMIDFVIGKNNEELSQYMSDGWRRAK